MGTEFTRLPGQISDGNLHDAIDRLETSGNTILSVVYRSEPLSDGYWYIFYRPVKS